MQIEHQRHAVIHVEWRSFLVPALLRLLLIYLSFDRTRVHDEAILIQRGLHLAIQLEHLLCVDLRLRELNFGLDVRLLLGRTIAVLASTDASHRGRSRGLNLGLHSGLHSGQVLRAIGLDGRDPPQGLLLISQLDQAALRLV